MGPSIPSSSCDPAEYGDRIADVSDQRPTVESKVEVLPLMGRGATHTEICQRLYIGEGTVKTHVARILTRRGLRDRAAAIVFAFDHGLVRPLA